MQVRVTQHVLAWLDERLDISGLRAFSSCKAHGLAIERGVFTRGRNPYEYLGPLKANLFLSANERDVNWREQRREAATSGTGSEHERAGLCQRGIGTRETKGGGRQLAAMFGRPRGGGFLGEERQARGHKRRADSRERQVTLIPRQDLRLAIRNQTANDGHDVRDAASLVH